MRSTSSLLKIVPLLNFLFFIYTNLPAQDIHHIKFDSRQYVIQDFSEAVPLFKFSGSKVHFEHGVYEVKFPKDFIGDDTAFAFIFFQGWENSTIPQYTLALVGNYKYSPTLVVDYNNNLDFSDDRQMVWENKDTPFMFELPNSSYEGAKCIIRLNKAVFENPEQLERIKGFTSGNPDFYKNKAVAADYWWEVGRINYKTTTAVFSDDSVRIVLVDGNGNGLFNDFGWDRVVVGDDLLDGFILKENLKISINDKFYTVKEVETGGNSLVLESTDIQLKRLGEGSTIPNFSFYSTSGEKKDLYTLSKGSKFTVLDFWGTWCKPCIESMPALAAMNEKHKEVRIIGLISHDDKVKAIKFVEKNKMSWPNGFATDEMLKGLLVNSFPRYILLDENHKIIKFRSTLADIEAAVGRK